MIAYSYPVSLVLAILHFATLLALLFYVNLKDRATLYKPTHYLSIVAYSVAIIAHSLDAYLGYTFKSDTLPPDQQFILFHVPIFAFTDICLDFTAALLWASWALCVTRYSKHRYTRGVRLVSVAYLAALTALGIVFPTNFPRPAQLPLLSVPVDWLMLALLLLHVALIVFLASRLRFWAMAACTVIYSVQLALSFALPVLNSSPLASLVNLKSLVDGIMVAGALTQIVLTIFLPRVAHAHFILLNKSGRLDLKLFGQNVTGYAYSVPSVIGPSSTVPATTSSTHINSPLSHTQNISSPPKRHLPANRGSTWQSNHPLPHGSPLAPQPFISPRSWSVPKPQSQPGSNPNSQVGRPPLSSADISSPPTRTAGHSAPTSNNPAVQHPNSQTILSALPSPPSPSGLNRNLNSPQPNIAFAAGSAGSYHKHATTSPNSALHAQRGDQVGAPAILAHRGSPLTASPTSINQLQQLSPASVQQKQAPSLKSHASADTLFHPNSPGYPPTVYHAQPISMKHDAPPRLQSVSHSPAAVTPSHLPRYNETATKTVPVQLSHNGNPHDSVYPEILFSSTTTSMMAGYPPGQAEFILDVKSLLAESSLSDVSYSAGPEPSLISLPPPPVRKRFMTPPPPVPNVPDSTEHTKNSIQNMLPNLHTKSPSNSSTLSNSANTTRTAKYPIPLTGGSPQATSDTTANQSSDRSNRTSTSSIPSGFVKFDDDEVLNMAWTEVSAMSPEAR